MTYTLTKIHPLSLAKLYAFFMAFMTLFFAIPFGLILILTKHSLIGLLVMIFVPTFYGAVGFIFGGLGATIFNFIIRFTGGLQLDIKKSGKTSKTHYPDTTHTV